MKKLIILSIAAMALASCSSDNDDGITGECPVEIKLSTGINEVLTKAPINAGSSVTGQFVASKVSNNYSASNQLWTTTASFTAGTSPSAAFSFSTKQYYPPSGSTVYVKGYYPSGALSDSIITFTGMNGTQDVMYSNEQSGNRATAPVLAFVFSHLLTQLQFNFVAGTSFDTSVTVSSVVIKSQKTPSTLNINRGTLTYNTAADVTISGNYAISSGAGTTATDYPMVKEGEPIVLKVTTSDGAVYDPVNITGLTTAVGKAHLITLTFSPKEITATATVTAWGTGSPGSSTLQ